MDIDNVSRLRGVIGRLSRQLSASASNEGLTPSQASALAQIADRGPLSLTELASLEGINPTMLSRIIGRLDDARFIRRVSNPEDLRSATVEITDDGRQINKLIRDQRGRIVAECVASLDESYREALHSALPALEALAQELSARTHAG